MLYLQVSRHVTGAAADHEGIDLDDEDRLILYQERFGRGKALLQMDFFPPNGRPRAKVWNRRKSPANWVHVDGEGMTPGQWHFVTFTVTGAGTGEGTLKITVDGRAVRHNFQMLDVRDVGYGFVGSGKGLIDELAIFNRTLSEGFTGSNCSRRAWRLDASSMGAVGSANRIDSSRARATSAAASLEVRRRTRKSCRAARTSVRPLMRTG